MNLYVWALCNSAKHDDEVLGTNNLTEAQYVASLSFKWNLGAGAVRNASWLRLVKAGRMEQA